MIPTLDHPPYATPADDADDTSWFGAEAHVVTEPVPRTRPSPRTLVDDLDDPEWLSL